MYWIVVIFIYTIKINGSLKVMIRNNIVIFGTSYGCMCVYVYRDYCTKEWRRCTVCVCVCVRGATGASPQNTQLASYLLQTWKEKKCGERRERRIRERERERERERACYLFATRIHPLTFRWQYIITNSQGHMHHAVHAWKPEII